MRIVSKKVLPLLLAVCLFLQVVPALAAPGEDYNRALEDLNYYLTVYLDDMMRDECSLEEISAAFKSLGSYQMAGGFYQYAYILMCLERGDYRAADIFKKTLEKNTSFSDYLKDEQFIEKYPSIHGVEELLIYVDGRIAENNGDNDTAVEYYQLCSLFYDSQDRMFSLLGGGSDVIYQNACTLMENGEYGQAYPLFQELTEYNYESSADYAEFCKEMALALGQEIPGVEKVREWSEWLNELPEDVNAENAEIEERVLYRSRKKETTSSKEKSLAGWIRANENETVGGFSEWSSWGPTEIAAKDTREIQKKTMYRFKELEYDTSSKSSMSGWEMYNTQKSYGDYGSWSSWSTSKVSESSTRQVETKTQYRYRNTEYTTSSSSSLSGWTLYDSKSEWSSYGSWSNWSTSAVSSSDSRQVETKTQYSYRTSSNSQTYTDWSAFSGWSTTQVTASDTVKVEQKTQYGYYYWVCPKCGTHWHGFGFKCASWGGGGCGTNLTKDNTTKRTVWGDTPQSKMNWKDFHGTGSYYTTYDGERVFRFPSDPNKSRVVYRYATREITYSTVYSDWSSWSDSYPSSYAEIQTRTVYRYRDRQKNTTYYYQRTGSWSDWSDSKSSGDQVENRTLYRYRDKAEKTTYYFRRWSNWSDWSDTKYASDSNRQVDSATFYRYRDRLDSGEYSYYRWLDWTEWSEEPKTADSFTEIEKITQYRYK